MPDHCINHDVTDCINTGQRPGGDAAVHQQDLAMQFTPLGYQM